MSSHIDGFEDPCMRLVRMKDARDGLRSRLMSGPSTLSGEPTAHSCASLRRVPCIDPSFATKSVLSVPGSLNTR